MYWNSVSLVVESQVVTLESSSIRALVANLAIVRPQPQASGRPASHSSMGSVVVFSCVTLIDVLPAPLSCYSRES